ncbi:MAG: O-antigen ligase family protein [bacterium]|nr:O-antigen ligase family protein [bacterium]
MNLERSGDRRAPLSSARGIYALIVLQLIALGLWLAFAQVAHYGYRNYFILMALAWAGGAALSGLTPGLRWFWFALIGLALPRIAGIILQAPTHNLVFPWLAGLALGLLLRLLLPAGLAVLRRSPAVGAETSLPVVPQESRPLALRAGPGLSLAIFGAFLMVGALRAFFEAYSPYVLLGLPVMDLEMAPGVSANYGFALSMLLILNLTGPLLFYFASHIYARAGCEKASGTPPIAWQLLAGIACAALIHLCALVSESFGFTWLAAGAGDFWQQAGRLPGILTDSGSSALLTPLLIASLAFACYHASVAWQNPGGASPLRRYGLPGLIAGALSLAVLFPLSYWHGRAFFINTAAVFAFALLVFFALWMRSRRAREESSVNAGSSRVRFVLASGALLVVAGLGLYWFYRTSEVPAIVSLRAGVYHMLPRLVQGEWFAAFALLDPARTDYFRFGVRLIQESPWIGHGLNSFQVELTRFVSEAPEMMIDNPGSLPLGLLSDSGLFGAALFGMLAVWVGLGFARLWRAGDSISLWLAGLPLALAPAMLLGYHLVLSEFCVIMFIPFFLFEAASVGALRTRWASVLHTLAAMLAALWLFGVVAHFASTSGGPELWRSSKIGGPQPALSR